ncbi:hypothetical protein BV22DRAFT_1095032 [Leucogyrophana mollusca]|uniref:Uncharacterized protein n=1 Tax=Leucogyrophana mollusca TaxID=85980 RepID=A0ACB8B918_9AGAM|nr:hypothetical protein BV22DRAFT_1095032 [Leucogyrophana mollusca]
MTSIIPPLYGDGNGIYRVHLVGNCGTGKSTLGAHLARALNVPFISLDTLFWGPNWTVCPPAEFRAKVRTALQQQGCERGWVVDGKYTRFLNGIVTKQRTDVIWLDPPLALYFPRLVWRTVSRLLGFRQPCAAGCRESAREVFFSRRSIMWWCLSRHWAVRRMETENMRLEGVSEVEGGRMRRIGGWGGELQQWTRSVEEMVKTR